MPTLEELYDTKTYDSERDRLPSFRWVNHGDKIVGTVQRRSVVANKNDDKGRDSLVIELKTDHPITQRNAKGEDITSDEWAVWLKVPSQAFQALFDAVKAQNAPKSSPQPGDRFSMEYVDDNPPKKPGHNPMKVFKVSFRQAVPETPDDLI